MNINQNILRFLRSYSYKVWDINRLMVSSFLVINGIYEIKNEFIRKYVISENKEELLQLDKFTTLFNDNNFDIEELIKLFEFVISPKDKEVNGAVYTPKYIREYIVKDSITKFGNEKSVAEIKYGDIACGCGGFFITIAKTIRSKIKKSYYEIYRDNIFGLDIQSYSIERTKIILSLLAISEGEDVINFAFNLYEGNALSFDWNNVEEINQNKGFDIIVGNPPYVGTTKIDDESKILLKNWKVSSSGKADLYIPFFEIGLENLNNRGVLGYITVNTFLKSLNGRAVRSYFSENKFAISIIDFGGEQLFKNRSTYTCLCTIGKRSSSNIQYVNTNSGTITKIKKKDFVKIPYSKLNDYDGWYLNRENVNNIITKIENTGKPLGTKFEIRNGFATLKNNLYVFNPIRESDEYFYFEKDDKEYKVEKKICKNAIKPNILKSESEILRNTQKIIFPYRYIDEKDLFKNNTRSIQIINERDLKENFPNAYKYLCQHKHILSKRDKGKRQYEVWYAYGRNQALTLFGYKLLFPYISDYPYFVFTDDKELMFYNGFAVISSSKEELLILQKILMSNLFWFYVKHTSKPYSGNYFSMAKNYVKNFGVSELSNEERTILRDLTDKDEIEKFLLNKYNIKRYEIFP